MLLDLETTPVADRLQALCESFFRTATIPMHSGSAAWLGWFACTRRTAPANDGGQLISISSLWFRGIVARC
jgi:hypothetical protein